MNEYIQAELPKPPPAEPVRVSRRSQLMAALRQNARPIIIEDPDLARPFARLLQAREMRPRILGGLVAEMITYGVRHYGAEIEERWSIGRYMLPGNAQRVILKPKGIPLAQPGQRR